MNTNMEELAQVVNEVREAQDTNTLVLALLDLRDVLNKPGVKEALEAERYNLSPIP